MFSLIFPRNRNVLRMLLAVLPLFLFAGCATTPEGRSDDRAFFAELGATAAAKAVLDNNPKYAGALDALAAGVEVAANGGTFTIEQAVAFVKTIGDRHGVDPATQLILVKVVQRLGGRLTSRFGPDLDPKNAEVRSYLLAFSGGIRDGVTLHRAYHPA